MPWHTQAEHPDCPSDRPWAVVKDADGDVAGCFPTEDEANAQVAALYAQEEDAEAAADPVLAAVYDAWNTSTANPARATLQAESEPRAPFNPDLYRQGRWRGVLVLETVETGDSPRREFAEDSLIWRDLPLPIYWQKLTTDGHDNGVIVARADVMERSTCEAQGKTVPCIKAEGVFDLAGEDGREAHRLIGEGFMRGVSVSIDETQDSDVEMVFPEGVGEAEPEEGEGLEMLLGPMPEKMVFNRARIMDACLTGQPAFQEAYVELVADDAEMAMPMHPEDDEEGLDGPESVEMSSFTVVAPHESPTAKGTWNGAANEARLASPLPVETARAAYAWIDNDALEDGQVPKSACKFIHHNIGSNGQPGAANLTACSAGIAVLNGGRGGTTIPADDREGVYGHLAGHLRQGGQEPPELMAVESADSLAAAAAALGPDRGLVVVVRPAEPDAVAVEGGLSADELHVTVGYYGHADEAAPELIETLHGWAAGHAEFTAEANVGGLARMGADDPQAVTMLIEASDLADLRRDLESVAEPDGTHPHFTPHVTLGYGIDFPGEVPASVALNGVELWVAGERFRGGEALTASMAPPVKPPADWLRNPKLSGPTAPKYLESGRCYGHLAVWGVCHMSFMPKVCVTPPKGSDYSGFRTGSLTCAGGEEVAVGQITLGALHAPASLGFAPTLHHYEHSGHAVADVAIGEDDWGIWFAGAMRPDTTDRHLRVLNASGVSGDWRRTRTGKWRLAGALVVNVPGFPVPRVQTYVSDGEQTALVAAGVLRPELPRNVVDFSTVVERIARSVGLDHPSRRAAARAKADKLAAKVLGRDGGQ